MKVWYAVIQQVGGGSGNLTVYAHGVYSDRETAKRVMFDIAMKRYIVSSRRAYEDLEWTDSRTQSTASSIGSIKFGVDLECTEIELDAKMAVFY
jgi:hypothetical protein